MRRNSPFVRIFALTLLGALSAGAGYCGWRSVVDRFDREARRAIEANDSVAALKAISQLRSVGGDTIRTERLLANALRHEEPETARSIFARIVESNSRSVTPRDKLSLAQLSLETRKMDAVPALLDELRLAMANNPQFLLFNIQWDLHQGRVREAVSALEDLLAIDPNNDEGKLLSAQLLLMTGKATAAIQAKSLLREVAEGGNRRAIDALRLLATSPNLPLFQNDRSWLHQRLSNHPQARPTDRLLAATQRILVEPENRKKIIEQITAQDRMNNPDTVAQWLLALGETALAAEIAEKEQEVSQGTNWKIRFQQATLTKDFGAMVDLLQQADADASEAQRATLLALIEADQNVNSTPEPSDVWKKAQQIARDSRDPMMLLTLGRVAGRQGWWEAAAATYQEATSAEPRPMLRDRLEEEYFYVLVQLRRAREALAVAQSLHQRKPHDPEALNNVVYFTALLDLPVPADQLSRLESLAQVNTGSPFWSTLALVYYRQGRVEEVLPTLGKLEDRFQNHPSVYWLKIVALMNAGHAKQAQDVLAKIDTASLFPEENAALQKIFQ